MNTEKRHFWKPEDYAKADEYFASKTKEEVTAEYGDDGIARAKVPSGATFEYNLLAPEPKGKTPGTNKRIPPAKQAVTKEPSAKKAPAKKTK